MKRGGFLKRTTPLRRKTRLRPVGKTSHAKRPRDFEHMAWVSTRPCLARLLSARGLECEGRIHVHHAFGRRVVDGDQKTIPLCDKHHREWHVHNGIFNDWDRARRQAWSTWAVSFTQLERQGGVL